MGFEAPLTRSTAVGFAKASVSKCTSIEVASRINMTVRDEIVKKNPFGVRCQYPDYKESLASGERLIKRLRVFPSTLFNSIIKKVGSSIISTSA